ncbi:hypothetical protein BY458DRAFT_512558 [Sporodiniella umbellata]|nr:hypothetical protein BY458DRAFT_512558 [Sporodiniella umbellata]
MATIPISRGEHMFFKKNETIKQGLVLCTRTEQWYAKKRTQVQEIKLRKTRLRWRRFVAVLKADRLELYHPAALKTNRLAHLIYFNPSPPLRPAHLSLVSPKDAIWSLEYTNDKHTISFHFQSSRLSESQDWYKQIYYRLPNTSKKPVPTFVDISVKKETTIRIPLDYFRERYKHGQTEFNLSPKEVKLAVFDLIQKELPTAKNWKLVWTLNDYIEPIDEKTQLIGCQLIEQYHQLELRQQPFITQKTLYEGLLKEKSTYYTLLYGNQLFFLDEYYYNNDTGSRRNWFSATAGMLKKSANHLIKKRVKNMNASTSHLASHLCLPPPDPSKLAFAKSVLDLSCIQSVEQSDQKDVIAIRLKNSDTLYYQAPNTSSQKEWLSLIRKNMLEIKQPKTELFNSDVIFSSMLYVKKNYSRHYTSQYCILCKNAKESVLMMFDITPSVYPSRRVLTNLESAYVYTGNECVMDQLVHLEKVPPCYYQDQTTTQSTTTDCVFVIWQLASRHCVVNIRENLSLLKRGHHLGQKGDCWIFKAKSKQQRDTWLSFLHK